MATKQVRKPGRPAKKARRKYASGGLVDNVRQKFDRGAQLDAAEAAAMGQPAAQATPQAAPANDVQLSPSEQAWLEQNRAREAAAEHAAKPAWKRALGWADGGVVHLSEGDRVPDVRWGEDGMDPRYAVAVDSRQQWQEPPTYAPPMSSGNQIVAPARQPNPSYAARPGMRATDNVPAPRESLVYDNGRVSPSAGYDNAQPVTGQSAQPLFDRANRAGAATSDWYQGAVDAMPRGMDAAVPAMSRAADKTKAFAQEAWNASPIKDAAAAVGNWADEYNRNAFGPRPAATTAQAAAPARETRRPGGTIGRVGRTPRAPTDADLFPPPAADAASPPGAVPAAPRSGRGPSRQQGAELTQQFDKPYVAGQYGNTTVYRNDVPAAQQDEYGQAIFSDSARGATRAGFDQDLRRFGSGVSQLGGAVGAVSAADRLSGQRAMADNALLQKWYSIPEDQRGRMPASVENAMYRGADDTETAFNVARARIMQTPMDPGRQAQALVNLDKTRADMLNQSQQTRQEGEYQQGQLGNERERTGVARQQVEQTGQNQQAQMAHLQRSAQLALDQANAEGILIPAEPLSPEVAVAPDARVAHQQRAQQRLSGQQQFAKLRAQNKTLEDYLSDPALQEKYPDIRYAIDLTAAQLRPQKYAGGGMVSPQAPVYGGAPDAQRADPLINAYRVYTTQSKAMGAPTVPFAEFSSLYAGAAQGTMQPPVGMAGGGAVPAAGKMVIDTDPNARTDSIPAMIDGEQPAALNSGEFVFPTDVTSYYGTKMLSGMIEKARQQANGSKPSGRSAG